MAEASRFFSMTPGEIALVTAAHQAKRDANLRRLCLLGRLTALAVHAPDRLPAAPQPPLPDMTDDEIKRRLLSWRGKDDAP